MLALQTKLVVLTLLLLGAFSGTQCSLQSLLQFRSTAARASAVSIQLVSFWGPALLQSLKEAPALLSAAAGAPPFSSSHCSSDRGKHRQLSQGTHAAAYPQCMQQRLMRAARLQCPMRAPACPARRKELRRLSQQVNVCLKIGWLLYFWTFFGDHSRI